MELTAGMMRALSLGYYIFSCTDDVAQEKVQNL